MIPNKFFYNIKNDAKKNDSVRLQIIRKGGRKNGNKKQYKNKTIIFILFFINYLTILSQTKYTIKGKLIDTQNKAVSFASVVLLSNNQIYTYAISNDAGYFEIKNIPKGKYILKINSLGYQLFEKNITINLDVNLRSIILNEDISKLDEVVLKLPPKTIEQNARGIVLNVANTPLAKKETSLDILKISPNVSMFNGLEVLGSKRIKITLNGQNLHIKPDKILEFINKIKPENIKKIEIIDSGNADFEGEQDAQINIYTVNKKGFMLELETSLSYNKTNGFGNENNISLYFHKNKWIFFNYLYYQNKRTSHIDSSRTNIENQIFYNKAGKGNLKRLSFSFSGGINYEIDSLSSLGFMYDFMDDKDKDHKIFSAINIITSGSNDSLINRTKLFNNLSKTHTFSLQYNHKIDTLESTFVINTEYVRNKIHIPLLETEYFYKNNILTYQNMFKTDYKNIANIYGIKTEWNKFFQNENEILLGVKFSSTHINDQNFYKDILEASNKIINPLLFRQDIYAGYINYYFDLGKFNFSTGLRSEYTQNYFGLHNINENSNENIRLLPNLKISRQFGEKNYLMMYLARKISRPSYYSFNLNIEIIDSQHRSTGNPQLKPMNIYRYITTYVYNKKYALMFRYDYTTDNILHFTKYLPNEGYTITKPINTGNRNYALLLLSIPVNLNKWWKTTNKIYYAFTNFKTDLFPDNNFSTNYLGLSTNQTIDLSKHTQIYINAYYTGKNRYLNTTYEPNYRINLSFATIPFKNSKIFIVMNDIFNTSRNKYTTDNYQIITENYSKYTTRFVYFKLRYTFQLGKDVNVNKPEQILENEKNRTGK